MKLLVVIPFCSADAPVAMRLLEWIDTLGKLPENDCLLVAANRVSAEVINRVAEQARTVFASATIIQPPFPLEDERHPIGPNWMFETTIKHMSNTSAVRPFLWLEPDAVPTRAGWLQSIESEYVALCSGGKCILTNVIVLNQKGYPNRVPSGVAVYPADAFAHYRSLQINRKVAWDVQFADRVVSMVAPSKTILSRMNRKVPPVWIPRRTAKMPPNAVILSELPKEVVLVHPAKDDGLISILRGDGEPSLSQLLMAWRTVKDSPKAAAVASRAASVPSARRFIHCVERHVCSDPKQEKRIEQAFHSWVTLYKTGRMIPCHVWQYPRSSTDMNDLRGLPYLKDILVEGMTLAKDDDVVVWTNDDAVLHGSILGMIDTMLKSTPACTSMRINFQAGECPSLFDAFDTTRKVQEDLGRDLFAFKKSWLLENWDNIPDFFLGELEFDLVLTALIRKTLGIFSDRNNILKPNPKCELPKGYLFHENHVRQWVAESNRKSPSKLHNMRLAIQWYSVNGFSALIPTF